MNQTSGEQTPQPPSPKVHISQNMVIAILGTVTTIVAAILPWALDRFSQEEPSPTAVQATFTIAPFEYTATNTMVPASSTPEPPTATEMATATLTPSAETGIYNAFLAIDFAGNFIHETFKPNEPIYLFFDINDPKNRNVVKVTVSVVDVPGYLTGAVTYELEDKLTEPSKVLTISKGKLATGKYKLEIYLNNVLDETIEFEVIAG